MECTGFWTDCGYQWLIEQFGLQIAAVIVVVAAVLWMMDHLLPDIFWLRSSKRRQFKTDVPMPGPRAIETSTDTRHLQGKRK